MDWSVVFWGVWVSVAFMHLSLLLLRIAKALETITRSVAHVQMLAVEVHRGFAEGAEEARRQHKEGMN